MKDRLLHLLLLLGGVLAAFHPATVALAPQAIHMPTLLTLSGLMLLTKGIEVSGALDHAGRHMLSHLTHERTLALFLVAFSALLSTVLTNDIALFIVIPLTLGLRNLAGLPIGRLVIFEALAVNAGSLLTPIGNPQNILLWQLSHLSFAAFTWQMAPLALALTLLLLGFTALAFPNRCITVHLPEEAAPWQGVLMIYCSLLYTAFVACVEWGHPGWGFAGVLAGMALLRPRLLSQVDWSLIAVFALMFVDIRLLTGFDEMRDMLRTLSHDSPRMLFVSGVLASQVISNVPATILFTQWVPANTVLAYAVNVGGFGFVLGSLANLIALRMVPERGIWWRFHFYSMPFLALGSAVALLLLGI
ncbi:MAG: anion transporter [Ferrovum sp.]|nr:anion transporter [Ferrovum sp.]